MCIRDSTPLPDIPEGQEDVWLVGKEVLPPVAPPLLSYAVSDTDLWAVLLLGTSGPRAARPAEVASYARPTRYPVQTQCAVLAESARCYARVAGPRYRDPGRLQRPRHGGRHVGQRRRSASILARGAAIYAGTAAVCAASAAVYGGTAAMYGPVYAGECAVNENSADIPDMACACCHFLLAIVPIVPFSRTMLPFLWAVVPFLADHAAIFVGSCAICGGSTDVYGARALVPRGSQGGVLASPPLP
eukprot:2257907-Rhodomonas_salina.1